MIPRFRALLRLFRQEERFMHTFRLIAAAALLPLLASAETSKQTFKLIYAATDQDANEIFTSVRTIADIRNGMMDNPRQFIIEGTPDQLRMAEWIVRQLDIPPDAAGTNDTLHGIADTHGEDTARVFFLPPNLTPQQFNEVMTSVRTITDIRRVFGYSSRRAILARSSEEALDAADWLAAEMMRDSSTGELIFPKKPDTRLGADENHTRVFRYPRAATTQDFNEAMTAVRTLTDTRRVFGFAAKREIVMRGTSEQLAASDWVLGQLDHDLPMKAPQVSEAFPAPYKIDADQPKETLRLFYFTGSDAKEVLIERAKAIRAQSGVRRIFYVDTPRVLGVGGTADQLAKIELIARQ
jgi:hypothetical protein